MALTVTQNCQKLTQLWQCCGVRVHLFAYVSHWKVLKHLYILTMDVGSNQRWSTALTMTSWHHFHSTVTKYCQNLTQLCRCNSVRVHVYAYVPHWKEVKYFYICPIWMWEAIKSGLQPRPWHHGIISTWQSPRIAKIWSSFAGVTV